MEYFVAVAEELHFGRAAERLHIAQPSLSQQVRLLERQLGVTLLDRTSRRVELTPAGRTMLSEGRRLLTQSQRALRATRAAGAERLTVGFYGSAGTAVPDLLRAFLEHHASVEVSIRELPFGRVDDVLGGDVDVAFTRLLPGQSDAEIEVLWREPRVVALPSSHALAARAGLTFAELRDERFIVNPVLDVPGPPARWLAEQQRHRLPGRVAAEATTIQEILTLVASERGVCVVPQTVARQHPRHDVRYVPLSDADPAVVSIARPHGVARPVVEAFIRTARDAATRRR